MKKMIVVGMTICMVVMTGLNSIASGSEEDHVCFSIVDGDHNGWATEDEFKKVYTDGKVKFEDMDQDKDGKLTHEEYEEYLSEHEE